MLRTVSLLSLLPVLTLGAHAWAHGEDTSPAPELSVWSERPSMLEGNQVTSGFVVVGPNDSAVTFTPDADSLRQGFRLALTMTDLGNGFYVGAGEITHRHYSAVRADALGFHVGEMRYQRAFLIEGSAGVSLIVDARVTFNLFQAAFSEVATVREVEGDILMCSSQSQVSLFSGIQVERSVVVGLLTTAQGDPFHIGTGQDCAGDGPVWVEGRTLGLAATVALPAGVRLDAGLLGTHDRLAWDLEDHAQDTTQYGVLEGDAWLAQVELTAPF